MRSSLLDRYSPPTLLALTSLFWAGNMVIGRAEWAEVILVEVAYVRAGCERLALLRG